MSPTRRADPDLDDLIAEITIDCYDEDEVLIGLENAFDEHVGLFAVRRPPQRRSN